MVGGKRLERNEGQILKVSEDLLNAEHSLKCIIERSNLNVHPQMRDKEKVIETYNEILFNFEKGRKFSHRLQLG